MIKPYKGQFILLTLLMLAVAGLNISLGFINRRLVDGVLLSPGATVADALKVIAVMAAATAAMVAGLYCAGKNGGKAGVGHQP